ncbi:hypothetical protein LEMLEM_LOCUS2542, partial [Lemmus lemmus]
ELLRTSVLEDGSSPEPGFLLEEQSELFEPIFNFKIFIYSDLYIHHNLKHKR